ncbi:hypothetical protein ABZ679_35520, partial [Streptomyces fimicarius]
GPHAPYRQSQRMELYKDVAEKLLAGRGAAGRGAAGRPGRPGWLGRHGRPGWQAGTRSPGGARSALVTLPR